MINLDDTRRNKISSSLLRAIYNFFQVYKVTRHYGTDEQLFSSEIHMIRAIKENEGIHVTGLANKLGVTKGAVSQVLIRLENKSLIKKDRDPYNQSRILLGLTSKGETAYLNYEEFRDKFDDMIEDILAGASRENVEFLKDFLATLGQRLGGFQGPG